MSYLPYMMFYSPQFALGVGAGIGLAIISVTMPVAMLCAWDAGARMVKTMRG